VVIGGPGSGKTVLALEFLCRGAMAGEPGVYVTFEERAEAIRLNALSMGWDLATLEKTGKISIIEARLHGEEIVSGDFDIQGMLAIASGLIKRIGARRIVMDALDVLLRICGDSSREHNELSRLHNLLTDQGLTSVNITWADTERGRGPTGTCIRTRQAVIARNIATDLSMTPWREAAVQHGYASSAALPLVHESEVLGALMVYAPAPDSFDHGEVTLLTDLASDLAYGIAMLRIRAGRAEAEAALRTSEQLQRAILDNIPDPAWMKNLDGTFAAVNKAWLADILHTVAPPVHP
jgi:hypothetical protein